MSESIHENCNSPDPLANSTPINVLSSNTTFIPERSEQLSKQIKKRALDLGLARRPPEKVAKLFTDRKPKLRTGQCSCVVYGIPCKGCRKWYYGETTWIVDDRSEGHHDDARNIAKNPIKTALVRHMHETGHHFNFDNKKIMKKVRSKRTLKIHEANQIILHASDAAHLSPIFYNLIN